jgi:hypothetical protein
MHIAFNLWALSDAGPIVEEIFDRKKMLVIYFISGVASMMVSFVWYVYVREDVAYVSAGASGAVSGLIGAALFGARRMGPNGAPMVKAMTRWALYLLAFGFLVRGINNAAHIGGFVVAGLMAMVIPLGLAKSVTANRALSGVLFGFLGALLACTTLMLLAAKDFPISLREDEEPRSILGFRYFSGADDANSDQRQIWNACVHHLDGAPTPEALRDCELNVRVNSHQPGAYAQLADLKRRAGERQDAAVLLDISARLHR